MHKICADRRVPPAIAPHAPRARSGVPLRNGRPRFRLPHHARRGCLPAILAMPGLDRQIAPREGSARRPPRPFPGPGQAAAPRAPVRSRVPASCCSDARSSAWRRHSPFRARSTGRFRHSPRVLRPCPWKREKRRRSTSGAPKAIFPPSDLWPGHRPVCPQKRRFQNLWIQETPNTQGSISALPTLSPSSFTSESMSIQRTSARIAFVSFSA